MNQSQGNVYQDTSPLLTWLDVERRLKRATNNFSNLPDGVADIFCYANTVEITHTGSAEAVLEWLAKKELFLPAEFIDPATLKLQIGDTRYPITLQNDVTASAKKSVAYPLWQEHAYRDTPPEQLPQPFANGPTIAAFHSFKGGVGRTTSLMTYATAWLNANPAQPVKLLLIDADLEAPGISFWLSENNRPGVSFIQFLEAMHYPPSGVADALDYFAAELRKTSLNVEGNTREVFILPAFLDIAEIMDMPITPAHIARNPDNPWQLADYLHQLGQKLGVGLILVDLRAGLSELASPLLFDPRIEHFFVTTVAPQSVTGMSEILKRVHHMQQALQGEAKELAKPTVILSLLTEPLKNLPVYGQALEKLNRAYPADDDISEGIEWVEAAFHESLLSIGSIHEAFRLLPDSWLYKTTALPWAKGLGAPQSPNNAASEERNDAHALQALCTRLQFAEQFDTDDLLITDPLRNLAKHYSRDLPNIISVGAKGAGKTFTWLQICATRHWHAFLRKLGHTISQSARIFPFLSSHNLEKSAVAVKTAAIAECEGLLDIKSKPESETRSRIQNALSQANTDWHQLWESLISEQFNATSLAELNAQLIARDQAIILLIDGLEDNFNQPNDKEQQRALHALLQLPNRLDELANRRIGLICFIRADYVQAAIRQNAAQFLARYQAFKLEWTAESFLRLAYWICAKANLIAATSQLAEAQTTAQLQLDLERLWGKKMGRNHSKEAYSARWVFSALCDLNGRLQARDLVRFLKFAATKMQLVDSTHWSDRLLAPEAIRAALPDCSREKVDEASKEIDALRNWQETLAQLVHETRKVPFNANAAGLNIEQQSQLKELGIIYEDTERANEAERFYLPEIYRTGLGFQLAAAGRPRIQTLLKRNLGGLPF